MLLCSSLVVKYYWDESESMVTGNEQIEDDIDYQHDKSVSPS